MTTRFRISVALTLVIISVYGQLPALPSGRQSVVLPRPLMPSVSSRPANNRVHAALPNRPVLSNLLAKRPLQSPTMANSLAGQSVTLLPGGSQLKIGGLESDGVVSTTVIEDSHSGTFTTIPNALHHARAWHTATTLPDGTILIVGGIGADGRVVNTAEVFQPETQTFEPLPSNGLTPRVYHAATMLTQGQVLFTGGLSGDAKALDKAELWDFRSRTVISLPHKLKTGRYSHSATLLPNGNVLLLGGLDKQGLPVDKAEQFIAGGKRGFTSAAGILNQSNQEAVQLEASLPRDGATDVQVDSVIALRFSTPLRVETVNAETITLTGPQGVVAAKVIPAEGGMLAFITPKATLFPDTTYSLSLSGSSDANSHTIASSSFTFTTIRTKSGITLPDDEDWIPDGGNLNGDWKSHRPDSSWSSLPPLQAAAGVTALTGQTLRLNGKPLAKVTLQIGEVSTMTDGTGRFLLTNTPAGRRVLIIHGHTANQPGKSYGMFEVGVEIKEGKTTPLGYTVWMPLIDTRNATPLPSPTTREIVATTPRVQGLEVSIPAKAVLRDAHDDIIKSLTMTPVPVDRTPVPLPQGTRIPMFFTLQTHGAKVEMIDGSENPGAQIIYPNTAGLPAGASVDLWTHTAQRGWYIYGQGTVTADAKRVKPNRGVHLLQVNCMNALGLPGSNPAEAAPPGGVKAADPVDLATGLFVMSNTDLVLPDILPITIARTYRPKDSASRGFGIGCSLAYDIYLVGDDANASYAELILPDGGRVRYDRTSPGYELTNAVMEHTATPTGFYKSKLSYNTTSIGWDLQFQNGTIWRFTIYSPWVVLTEIQDRHGNTLTISRDPNSKRVSKIASPNGRSVELTYDGTSERISQVRDNIGRLVSYTYDAAGRLWKVTDPNNGVTEYSYDGSNQMLTIKDARGIVYLTNEYDTNGRVIKQTQADSTFYQLAYTLDGGGKVTQTDVTDPRGNIRRVTFNASGYVLTDTYALGRPEQQTCTYELQASGNLPLSVTDQLGRRTTFTYDSLGNPTSVTRLAGTPEAVTASFTNEPLYNQVATATDPLNHTVQFTYDSLGNLTAVTDPLGHQSTFTYGSAGQVSSATNALNKTVQFSYEGADLTTVTNPLGQSVSGFTDAAGRVLSVTNALGQVAKNEYDVLNRVTRTTDPLSAATQFAYDANSNLLSVTDARNKVIGYHYDVMDRIDTRTDPLLKQTTYLYDNNGNIRQVTDRKQQVTQLTYDALDRLTQVTYADNSTVSNTYDAGNRLTQVVDSINGTISYGYDNLDRLTSENTAFGTVSYGYNAAGRLTSKTIPGQAQITYVYDNANRLTQIQQGASVVTFAYDNANRLTTETLADGVVTQHGYDDASRLVSLTYKHGSTVLGDLTYEYDAVGRRVKMGGSLARTGLPQALSSAIYNDANRQTAFGTNSLTYDDDGNLTSDGTNSYTWNVRNQLVAMSGPGLSASFSYDAVGRRASKSINGSSTSYLYDGANIVQEQVGGSASANTLTGGVDTFFSRTDASGTVTPLRDPLGSVVALTDANGAIQTSYSYEPFGKATTSGTANSNSQKYTGREDDGTGLYYYRNRYYLPSMQRFISEDPIGLAGGINLYCYVGNNPISLRDSLGLKPSNSWADTWFDLADIRSAQAWWDKASAEMVQNGNWAGATGADVANGLLGHSGLPTVQNSGETLGSDASYWEKYKAVWKLEMVAGSWYLTATAFLGDAVPPTNVQNTFSSIEEYLGPNPRLITNSYGDKVLLSEDGLRRIRVDFNHPYPHQSPHLHVEELVNGHWHKSGPIYPKDVPQH
jgi:RHS repeat-associated protein